MEWKRPAATPRLGGDEVHVWRASLELGGDALARAWSLLTPDERRRALRMRFPVHRARAVASRAALRILLGRYLGVPPAAVELVVEPGGRPALDPRIAHGPRFSVSHAGALALYAFAADRPVGVDIERLRRAMPFERLAARFFAPSESEAMSAFPPELLPAAFFACWTRKEALFKAWGGESGLVPALKRFAVSVEPREPRVGVTFFADEVESARWSLASLDPGPGYAGAIAARGPATPTCFVFDWPA